MGSRRGHSIAGRAVRGCARIERALRGWFARAGSPCHALNETRTLVHVSASKTTRASHAGTRHAQWASHAYLRARLVARPAAFAGAICVLAAVGGDRAGAFSYFAIGGTPVRWAGAASLRYLSPTTFVPGSDPDVHYLSAMGLWNIVPSAQFSYSYERLPVDYPIDHFDGYSDTAAVPASELDPGVLGVTYMVNNGTQWYDMDMLFSDFPENVGWLFHPNPTCDVVTQPLPVNGFSFLLVATHELGHALGLGHDPAGDEPAGTPWFIGTMNPRYPGGGPVGQEAIIEVHTDDRNGCRFLYPHSGPSPPAQRDLANPGYCTGPVIGRATPITFAPAVVPPSGVVTARCVLENFGNQNQFNVRHGFYLSTDGVIETTDLFLASLLWDIAFEDAFEFEVEVDMPFDLKAGVYYLGSIIDDDNQVAEIYEDNNASVYCGTLTVTQMPPVIEPMGQVYATCGQPFTGPTPAVTRPVNMGPLTWSLDNPEPGMSIDAESGVMSWPSPIPAPFPYVLIVRATNAAGTSTQLLFVGVVESLPQIAPIADEFVPCGGPYVGPTPQVTSAVCMNPILNWSLDSGPAGMAIDHATGVVTWVNPVASVSPYDVVIRATNPVGNATQSWRLIVPGTDIDGDGDEDGADAAVLVEVLLGRDTNPAHVSAADVNCDGVADGADIQALAARLN